ncbi:hypothetical protein [Novosphingobium olei]|uniref:hypothetical protein n=1 Tax=Novosphingobium olei TaxID=2728851 RepID=UPI003090CEBB|nr:hypothetical protein NSDW_11900 [Novosphingobium olei]
MKPPYNQRKQPTRDYHRAALVSSIMLHADLDKLAGDERAIDSMARCRKVAPAVVRQIIANEIDRRRSVEAQRAVG